MRRKRVFFCFLDRIWLWRRGRCRGFGGVVVGLVLSPLFGTWFRFRDRRCEDGEELVEVVLTGLTESL